MEGSDTAGTVKAAGLPNITGEFTFSIGQASVKSYGNGATTPKNKLVNNVGNDPFTSFIETDNWVTLDASKSSAIYGNSTTVQPKSTTVKFIIKAFNAQTADSALIDVTQYASDLANRLQVADAPAVCTPFAFPSDTYVDIAEAVGQTSYSYTAPANGWISAYMSGSSTATGSTAAYLLIENQNNGIISCPYRYSGALGFGGFVPAKKGDVIMAGTSNTTISKFRFYYAQGEI